MIEGFGDDLQGEYLQRKSLSEQTTPNGRGGAGIGYVVIPIDVDRDLYVESCLRKNTVSILTEQGEFINDVPVGKLTLQFIEFPTTDGNNSRRLGSPVGFVNIAGRNKPVIFDVFDASDEFNITPEYSFNISRKKSGSSAIISGNGGTGDVIVSSVSSKGDNGFSLQVRTKALTGYFDAVIDGVSSFFSRKKINIKSGESVIVEIKDEEVDKDGGNKNNYARISFDNAIFKVEIGEVDSKTKEFKEDKTSLFKYDVDNATIYPLKKVTLGTGAEPMVLGDTLKALMDDFITAVSSITTATMLGTQPIINKAQVEALKQRTRNILSEYGFLD